MKTACFLLTTHFLYFITKWKTKPKKMEDNPFPINSPLPVFFLLLKLENRKAKK